MELSVIIAIIGVLVALTNVIVEVAKKATWDKLPTNILALIKDIAIVWYMIAALVVAGFMVAYAAMFGFDKLREIMNWGEKK